MADTPFAEFITNRRRELELTLGDVANGLGVSPITVSNWSSGDATPDPDQLVALADLLEVPSDDLAGMAGVKLKPPEPAVNLMPPAPPTPDDDSDLSTDESTGPIAMLRTTDDAAPEAVVEAETDVDEESADAPVAIPEPESDGEEVAEESPEPVAPAEEAEETEAGAEPDEMDSELADLIEEAAAEERREPEPAVVTQPPEEKQRPARRRPSIRRRRPAAEQPLTALPLTYVEDPKQLTRYRIRWALTVIILVVMFFILLWASRELLSALSEVRQAVTPGGIGS